jgi:phosphoserine phosphatase
MIGLGKASAVAAHASRYGLNLAASHSYGDDVSDIPFMELCGHRVIVNGSDPALTGRAGSPGWSVLTAS